jgi:FKBP-type peptidyl-prolyl cis-trans isomerase 2
VLDANPPLADVDLYFDVEVVAVRPAAPAGPEASPGPV